MNQSRLVRSGLTAPTDRVYAVARSHRKIVWTPHKPGMITRWPLVSRRHAEDHEVWLPYEPAQSDKLTIKQSKIVATIILPSLTLEGYKVNMGRFVAYNRLS